MSRSNVIEYKPEMGELRDLERIKKVLGGKSIEEQRKYFYSTWWAPRFDTSYVPLYETDHAAVVSDGIIVGAMLSDGVFLAGSGCTTEERSDNNGAGYKEYSEQVGFYFTQVPLDTKRCRYSDKTDEPDFFDAHKHIEEVVIDETVDEIGNKVEQNVRYVGSVRHWLSLKGYRSYLCGEIHLYMEEDKEAETTRVVIPEGVTEINPSTFRKCVDIKEVIFPSTLQVIHEDAFAGCTSLKEIILPDSVVRIYDRAFCGCTGVRRLKLPNGPVTIGRVVFSECTGLSQVVIPGACEEIKTRAFERCNENLRILCEVPEDKTAKWENTWFNRYSDRDGSYDYKVEYVKPE